MIEAPKVLAKAPTRQASRMAAPLDVLSDVLRVVRLSGAVLFRGELTAPWAMKTPEAGELARVLMPGAKQLMLFHLITEGHCWIDLEGTGQLDLQAGDIAVFPYGDSHTMASDLSTEAVPVARVLRGAVLKDGVPVCEVGGGGEQTRIVCGFLHCDELLFNPLCKALPPLIHARSEDAPAISLLAATVRHAIYQSGGAQPGNTCLLSRLSELLFIEVLRRHIASLPSGVAGWLGALNDPIVGRALQLVHADPAYPWTVVSLARECATSRSLLAARFKEMLGQPPMRYLASWRLQLAAEMLRDGALGIAAIAERAGYESEPAFNRAFKRHAGEPPATWRDKIRRHE